jgi:uncharacterized protein (DUF302 family)
MNVTWSSVAVRRDKPAKLDAVLNQTGECAMSGTTAPGISEHVAPSGVAATVDALVHAIENAGLTVFARIDHAAGARAAGLAMPEATVLIYGHAKGGTPAMLAAPDTALDLPLRVLVRERADGKTIIAFHPVVAMLTQAGVPREVAARLEPAQGLLVRAIAG